VRGMTERRLSYGQPGPRGCTCNDGPVDGKDCDDLKKDCESKVGLCFRCQDPDEDFIGGHCHLGECIHDDGSCYVCSDGVGFCGGPSL